MDIREETLLRTAVGSGAARKQLAGQDCLADLLRLYLTPDRSEPVGVQLLAATFAPPGDTSWSDDPRLAWMNSAGTPRSRPVCSAGWPPGSTPSPHRSSPPSPGTRPGTTPASTSR